MKFRMLLGIMAIALISACAERAPRGGGDILAIGDSVMAWNGAASMAIPDQLEQLLGRDVVNRALPGAQIDNGSVFASAAGFNIQRQFPDGTWNWIVLNGGANDLGSDDCSCGACTHVVDRLIRADGKSGTIPVFLTRLRQSGAQILWMGYYVSPSDGGFTGCRDDLVLMEARIKMIADGNPAIHFVDGEDVINPSDRSMFASDRTHPSPKGSAALAAMLAREISRVEARSQN